MNERVFGMVRKVGFGKKSDFGFLTLGEGTEARRNERFFGFYIYI